MRRFLLLFTVAALPLALAHAAAGTNAGAGVPTVSPSAPAKRCTTGLVHAVIGGTHTCLKPGQRCNRRLDRQYHRYGFHCHSGRLTRRLPPAPLPPPPLSGVVASIPAPGDGTLEATEDAVWVVSMVDETKFLRIDPGTNAVVATVLGGSSPSRGGYYGIGISSSAVWLASHWDPDMVSRVDPATNAVVAQIAVGDDPEGIAVTSDAIWVANHRGGSVSRIDPATNRTVATVVVGPSGVSGPHDIFAAAGAIWVDVPNLRSVVRIDPSSNTAVARIQAPGGACRTVAGNDDGVWVAGGSCGGGLDRIDPRTNTVVASLRMPELGGEAAGIAFGFGSVWVAVRAPAIGGYLVRVDPHTNKVVERFRTEGVPQAVAVARGSLWLRQVGHVLRINPSS